MAILAKVKQWRRQRKIHPSLSSPRSEHSLQVLAATFSTSAHWHSGRAVKVRKNPSSHQGLFGIFPLLVLRHIAGSICLQQRPLSQCHIEPPPPRFYLFIYFKSARRFIKLTCHSREQYTGCDSSVVVFFFFYPPLSHQYSKEQGTVSGDWTEGNPGNAAP